MPSHTLTRRDFLTGTSFALTGGSVEGGGFGALWGQGSITSFDGRDGELSLDGEVTTGLEVDFKYPDPVSTLPAIRGYAQSKSSEPSSDS